MTDTEANEACAKLLWPDAAEYEVDETHVFAHFGIAFPSQCRFRFDRSLDTCYEAELKLLEESKIEGHDHHQAFLDLLAEKELQANSWTACPPSGLVAHALAEVIVERGLV